MKKNKTFVLVFMLLIIFILPSFGAMDLKCDNCGQALKVESKNIRDFYTQINASFEINIRYIYPLLFSFPTPVICPSCHYISVPCPFSNYSNKEKINAFIKNNPAITETDFDAQPWLLYEYAAKMSEINEDIPILIGRCYLLAAWSSSQEELLSASKRDALEKLLPVNSLEGFIENPPVEDFSKGPSTQDWAKSIINAENKISKSDFNDSELALAYLFLGNFYFASNNIAKAEKYYNLFSETQTIKALQYTPDMVLEISGTDSLKSLPIDLKNKVKRSRKYIELAKTYFIRSLNEKSTDEKEIIAAQYLLGEIERSLGNLEESKKYYDSFISNPKLVFNAPEDKIKVLNDINFIFNNYLKDYTSNNNNENLDKQEEKYINDIFEKAKNDSMILIRASDELKKIKRRDLIFSKLKEYIKSGNRDLAEGAILSMSDATQEAVDLQVNLLKRKKYVQTILLNLRYNSNLIKKSDDSIFVNLFNTDPTPRVNITSYLVALDTDKCREAIVQRARKMFSKENIQSMAKVGNISTAMSGAQSSVLNALALIKNKESVELIINILNNIEQIGLDTSSMRDLAKNAGTAIEISFNKSFGFARSFSRPYGKEPQTINEQSFEVALKSLNEWYKDFSSCGKSVEQVALEGFKDFGYKAEPIDSVDSLKDLMIGLKDSYDPVRINCYKEIVKRTGIPYKACDNYFTFSYNEGDTKTFYTEWLEKNSDNLIYDKSSQRFIIKNNQ